jgi:putative ABC transport system permease protein
MTSLPEDFKPALRALGRSPGFVLLIVLMLGLGIGVNATVFSWLHSVLLEPLPGVPNASELRVVVPSYGKSISSTSLSYPDFRDLSDLTNVFSGVAGSHYTSALLSVDGQSQWIYGRVVTANAFDVLGVLPQLGRSFTQDEDRGEGGHPVLVISHALWRQRFAAAPDVLGRMVQINQHSFTIVGVAPASFQGMTGGLRDDFWTPLSMHNEVLQYGSYESRTFRWISALARIRPVIANDQAQAALSTLASRLEAAYPDSDKGQGLLVYSLPDSPVGGQAEFRPVLRLLLAVSACVFLIVLVNVANLLLVRAAARHRELAVRTALGAGRLRLLRQLFVESLIPSAIGAVFGILLARWAVHSFALLYPASSLPVGYDFQLDGNTLLLIVLLTIISTIVLGLTPAFATGEIDLAQVLREAGRSSSSGFGEVRIRNLLVIAEIALALMLVIGAGLSVRGFQKARAIDLGFDSSNLLSARLSLVPNGYTPESAKVFDRQLQQRLAAMPGVTDVALASALPLSVDTIFTATVDVEGYSSSLSEDRQISFDIVSGGYFSTMRILLLSGRDFTDADDASAPNTAIINESMARRYWPGVNPIGRRFLMAAGVAPPAPFTVVGLVKDTKYRSLSEPATPFVYLAYQQRPLASLFMGVVLRTEAHSQSFAPVLRREIHALDPSVEPLELHTVDEAIQPAFSRVRAASIFLLVLAATALFLASFGLYGVMSYAVTRRFHEIALRIALGAQPASVRNMVLLQGLRIALKGILLGLVGAFNLTRLLSAFLYGLSPRDPVVFVGVAGFLALVALLSSYLPALRATRVDPLVSLRSE